LGGTLRRPRDEGLPIFDQGRLRGGGGLKLRDTETSVVQQVTGFGLLLLDQSEGFVSDLCVIARPALLFPSVLDRGFGHVDLLDQLGESLRIWILRDVEVESFDLSSQSADVALDRGELAGGLLGRGPCFPNEFRGGLYPLVRVFQTGSGGVLRQLVDLLEADGAGLALLEHGG
jgi:hypothetical protein